MYVVDISTSTSYLKDNIIESNATNEHYQQVRYGLQQQKVPQNLDKYKLEDNGILMDKE